MKILLVGLGGIGQRHARNLRALLGDRVELLAYRVRRLPALITAKLDTLPDKDVEAEHKIRAFADLDEALREKPDAAFICNPSSLHMEVARKCVQAGCDLFIEKPVSDSLDGISELLQMVEDGKRVAMVGYQLRFHPCVKQLAAVVKSGSLGRLLSVRAVVGEYLPGWHPYEDYRQMYASRADLGGGVILSQIHEFDYLYSIFGLPQRLYSLGGHWSDLEIDVEDSAQTLMQCVVDGRPLPVHVAQDYLQRPPSRQCEVIGDQGKVVVDFHKLSVTVYQGANALTPTVHSFEGFDRNELFLDELRHFLDCIERRQRPDVDLAAGVESLRIALAVKKSIASRRLVELSEMTVGAHASN